MIPKFKRSGLGYSVGALHLSNRCKCECGKLSIILASYRIIRPPSADIDSPKRGEQGAILICYDCAMEMWREEIEYCLRCHSAEETHFMLISEAFEIAESTAEESTGSDKKRQVFSQRWKLILEWIAQQEDGATVEKVAKHFNCRVDAIGARLAHLKRRGVLGAERRGGERGGRIHYWVI
jgi:hypothetical protein